MKKCTHIDGIISAAGLGLLTALCCFVVAGEADGGSIRMENYWEVILPNAVKMSVILIVAVPLLLLKWVKWRYTFINLPIYMCSYVPIRVYFRHSFDRIVPELAAMSVITRAVGFMLLVWGIQSIVFLVSNMVLRRRNK